MLGNKNIVRVASLKDWKFQIFLNLGVPSQLSDFRVNLKDGFHLLNLNPFSFMKQDSLDWFQEPKVPKGKSKQEHSNSNADCNSE